MQRRQEAVPILHLRCISSFTISKDAELIYKLGYLIMAALFRPICPVRPVCPDIIHILWISTFRGNHPHFVDKSAFRRFYPHILDIMNISIFHGYDLYWSHNELLKSYCLYYLSHSLILNK